MEFLCEYFCLLAVVLSWFLGSGQVGVFLGGVWGICLFSALKGFIDAAGRVNFGAPDAFGSLLLLLLLNCLLRYDACYIPDENRYEIWEISLALLAWL